MIIFRRCGLGGSAGSSTMFRSLPLAGHSGQGGDVLMYHIHPSSSLVHGHPAEYVLFQVLYYFPYYIVHSIDVCFRTH